MTMLYVCGCSKRSLTHCAVVIVCISMPVAIPVTSPDQAAVNITVGSPLTLMVEITGFNLPLTSITWMEDGQVLMSNTIITHGSFAAPPTTSTLVRGSIQSSMDNGTFEVVVENPAGQDTSTFTITVNGEQVSYTCNM